MRSFLNFFEKSEVKTIELNTEINRLKFELIRYMHEIIVLKESNEEYERLLDFAADNYKCNDCKQIKLLYK